MGGGDASVAFTEVHSHSAAARELLPSMQIGTLEGSSQAGQAIRQSAALEAAKTVIDTSKPYTFQVGKLGRHYQEWVYTPIHVTEPIVLLAIVYALSPSMAFCWTLTAGLFSGYLVYDEIHYWIHHGTLPWAWLRRLKAHHMAHHYAHPNENYGVSNQWTDVLFGSLEELEMKQA